MVTQKRRRPTIHDVAAASGVSRGTVSRFLNGGHNVSPGAAKAIQKAVKDTGYVVNQHARSLVTSRSHSVAFILAEPQERLFEDPNFNVLLHGATRALAEHDIMLLLTIAGNIDDRKRVSRYITSGHVDGALLVSSHSGDPLIEELRGQDIPVVTIGRPLGHEGDVPYVVSDDREGARQMTRYLMDRGGRKIATITGALDTSGGVDRLQGFREVAGHGAPVAEGDYTLAGGRAAMERLLAAHPDLDAVFVASDLMASGALIALRESGRRVPEDVAVGGFDDSPVAMSTAPKLTTMRQPWTQLSRELVRLLLAVIDGAEPSAIMLPTQLVVRDSA
ncbi:LacI family DNA-binding transcriptional regulator [Actinocorallia longicatena]|uniref:LacI family DNA-binding transcriptional regulator n=1 Tax=Actinocorallia longicatena TaxID=111803 RepID=A0ABP6PVP7_9ACTN